MAFTIHELRSSILDPRSTIHGSRFAIAFQKARTCDLDFNHECTALRYKEASGCGRATLSCRKRGSRLRTLRKWVEPVAEDGLRYPISRYAQIPHRCMTSFAATFEGTSTTRDCSYRWFIAQQLPRCSASARRAAGLVFDRNTGRAKIARSITRQSCSTQEW